jgi:hypothetical protein
MRVAPISVRIQSSHQYLFMLLGSIRAKAAGKMLMKLTPCMSSFFCLIDFSSSFPRTAVAITSSQPFQDINGC